MAGVECITRLKTLAKKEASTDKPNPETEATTDNPNSDTEASTDDPNPGTECSEEKLARMKQRVKGLRSYVLGYERAMKENAEQYKSQLIALIEKMTK